MPLVDRLQKNLHAVGKIHEIGGNRGNSAFSTVSDFDLGTTSRSTFLRRAAERYV